jgi:ribosome biogenesis GTPase / thiamine phosphate phosphatase
VTDIFREGLIVKAQSGFFTVETGEGLIVCQLRGKLKRGRAQGDIAALGDRVRITAFPDGSGVIEEVHERQRAIIRLDPRPQGIYQQVMLANPDQALFVFSCAQPEPRLRMLDRFLVVAERQKVPAIIVANKIDLVSEQRVRELFGMYDQPGYRVLQTSTRTGAGIEEFRHCLWDKLSALAGPSGAGKSSLLNAIKPGLGLSVSKVSAVNKGKHTTVVRQLFPLDGHGYVADTPGWKSLALWDITPEEMDAYFPEIAPLVAECQFSDCTHTHEPGCAVLRAVDAGRVHRERYESYLKMRAGQA